jgi:hypothetical protein
MNPCVILVFTLVQLTTGERADIKVVTTLPKAEEIVEHYTHSTKYEMTNITIKGGESCAKSVVE